MSNYIPPYFRQVQLMVDMLQQGSVISDDSQQAMEAIGLAKQLQVPGTFSLVKVLFLFVNFIE